MDVYERHAARRRRTSAARCLASVTSWLALCSQLLLSQHVIGMEFRLYHQPHMNRRLIIAEGPIRAGDASAFLTLANSADRDSEGLVTVILNSPGGKVEAAFRMVDAMDKVRVYTVVPNSAKCASACASILFASGARRSLLGTGMLGFHSCYRRKGSFAVDDSLCNEIIAANAMQRGITYSAINRFVKDHGADSLAWIGAHDACGSLSGLCRPGLLEMGFENKAALARSLDCSRLASPPSRLVCGDVELSRLDAVLAGRYRQALSTTASKRRLQDSQRAWLQRDRNRCSDKPCLLRVYQERIEVLTRTR